MALWTPAQISTSSWYDGSDSSTLFDAVSGGSPSSSGGNVLRWEDKSGNSRHSTKTSTAAPTRTVSAIGGLDAVSFGGSASLGATAATHSDAMIFAVANTTATSSVRVLFSISKYDFAIVNGFFQLSDRTVKPITTYPVADYGTATTRISSGVATVSGTVTGSLYRDGLLISSATVSQASTSTGSIIGAFSSGGQFGWSGQIGELISVPSVDMDTREKIEGYLAWKWGLEGNLPIGHPYKSAAPTAPDMSVLGTAPVAAWCPSLDTAGNGTTTLTDLSGNGNNGTLTNMDPATDWPSDTDDGGVRALDFDGVNDSVRFGINAFGSGLNGSTAVSFSFWIKHSGLVGAVAYQNVFFSTRLSGDAGALWGNIRGDGASAGKVIIGGRSRSSDSFKEVTSSQALSINTWHHILGVLNFAAQTITVYLDGVPTAASSVGFGSSTYVSSTGSIPDVIGSNSTTNPGTLFRGRIDDARIFDVALDATDAAYLYNSGSGRGVQPFVPDMSVLGVAPVAAWCPSLDATGNGTTTLTDLVGSNDGTLTNMDAATDWVADTGAGGVRTLDFDGTNDHVIAADSVDLRLLDQWSLNVWVNPTLLKNYGNVVWKSNASNNRGYGLITFSTGVWHWQRNGVSRLAGTIVSGAWSMLTATFDGTTLRLYTDGTEDYSGAYLPLVSGTDPLRIGADDNNNRYFNGQIDDIRIFNTALTTPGIAYLYNSGNGRGVQPAAGNPAGILNHYYSQPTIGAGI